MPQGLPLSHRPRGSRHLLVMNPDPRFSKEEERMNYPSKETHTAAAREQVDAAVLELVNIIARHVAREINLGTTIEKQELVTKPED